MNQTSFKPDFEIAVHARGASQTAGEIRELWLDLSRVTFIDSVGTRAVIQIEQAARQRDILLSVTRPGPEVTELLRTAGVIEHFHLRSDTSVAAAERSQMLDRIDLQLTRDPASPARSRVEVREAMARCERTEVSDVVFLVSEIVTNAVVHPRTGGDTPIGLRITTYPDGLRIDAEDGGEGFDPSVPVASTGERGRGLFLVDRFANRWGAGHVETHAGRRFRVWFELEWSGGRDAETGAW